MSKYDYIGWTRGYKAMSKQTKETHCLSCLFRAGEMSIRTFLRLRGTLTSRYVLSEALSIFSFGGYIHCGDVLYVYFKVAEATFVRVRPLDIRFSMPGCTNHNSLVLERSSDVRRRTSKFLHTRNDWGTPKMYGGVPTLTWGVRRTPRLLPRPFISQKVSTKKRKKRRQVIKTEQKINNNKRV